jgi:enamine deaminase RidA (YjgF/YER057c/UK114 family)
VAIERFPSGVPWESVVGYSRTVRAGPLVVVSGTTATSEDGVLVGQTLYDQARQAWSNVARALALGGAQLGDVIQTRMYVTDIARWRDAARAHAEVFGDVRPATAMVEVSALLEPRMLIEVEATAWVGDWATSSPA